MYIDIYIYIYMCVCVFSFISRFGNLQTSQLLYVVVNIFT